MGVNEQQALDDVMYLNRQRSLKERQDREASKRTLSIFSETNQSGTPGQPAP